MVSDSKRALRRAIRQHCIRCVGGPDDMGYTTRVTECNARGRCPLWPYRFGMALSQARKRGYEVDVEGDA